MSLTTAQASKIGGLTAGVGLVLTLAGAALVNPLVIGLGSIGAVAAAVLKLVAKRQQDSASNARDSRVACVG